ncbi:uridine diphosphate glucose pyrophosphatase NUDT14-like [Mustela nigripes]|uniref:uridine diphosphate glucose pyrophosphatase NUDT14-like n=1 Tax=Mustela nigripes TaxID=77151 RepID=UPI00281567C9|nr:uridine diphosphate glucose pyrophosphatase NUDT14-like [Mustela nigripes]
MPPRSAPPAATPTAPVADSPQKYCDLMKTQNTIILLTLTSSQRNLAAVSRQGRVPLCRVPGSRGPGQASMQQGAWSCWAGWRPHCARVTLTQAVSRGCGRSGCRRHLHGLAVCERCTGLTGSSPTSSVQRRQLPRVGGLAEKGELIEVTHLFVGGAQIFAEDLQVPKIFSIIFGISGLLNHVAPEVCSKINPRLFNSEAQ